MKVYNLSLVLFIICCFGVLTTNAGSHRSDDQIRFLENKGQWPEEILYQGIFLPINIYFLKDGLSFAQSGEEEEDSTGEEIYPFLVWNLEYQNINPDVLINAENSTASNISYIFGNDSSKWVIHPEQSTVINYKNIYNNIDLVYYGSENNLKYDYILHPGSDINSIVANYKGIEGLSINDAGELEIYTEWDVQIQKAPYSWQIIDGVLTEVEVQYEIINDSSFSFKISGDYISGIDLIIDPLFEFYWCSYTRATGSSDNRNYAFSNAMDNAGNVYLTGMVDGTYPITPGAYSGAGAVDPEIFVSKFSSDGTTLIYSTYISGSSDEMGLGIAVDETGRAYITGHAMANWTGSNTYPSTASAYQTAMYPSGGYDVILTVLNSTGTSLVYSTYLGGSGDDDGLAVAIDPSGYVYVTGHTYSFGNTFPTKGTSTPAQQTLQGYHDVFVAKFDITKTGTASLIYSIHLGGGGDDYGRSIAVNSAGNAFVTGRFQAIGSPNFPTTAGVYNSTYAGGWDNTMAFVTKLSAATPVTYIYSTYISSGIANAIAIDELTGDAFIAGATNTFSFPVTAGVIQPIHGQDALGNSNSDAFVAKLNSTGTALIYSTFLGGERGDGATGLSVNSIGEAYVCGTANTTFPTSPGGLQPNHATGGGDSDFFAVHLNSNASAYSCGGSTYIGGNDMDYGTSMYDYPSPKMSLQNHGGTDDTICISGTSHSTNFPTTIGVYGPNKINGISDQPVFFKLICDVQLLPIELLSFTGYETGEGIMLKWETAAEINNDYFTLQRSNASNEFTAIARIEGAGTTNEQKNYFYADENPYSGLNYYQLIMANFDGEISRSQIISVVNNEAMNAMHIYPNPSHEKINIIIEDSNFDLRISTATGKVVYELNNISSAAQIDISNLPVGVYFINALTDQLVVANQKFIKY